MTVRIIRLCRDEIDGVPLMQFELGMVYDVGASLGTYLVATGCAQAVLDEEAKALPTHDLEFRRSVRRWRDTAADVTRRRR